MAKRAFTFDAIAQRTGFDGWPDKSWLEVVHFTQCIQPWRKFLELEYGNIAEMFSCDDGDDPPDIVVRFEQGERGFEMAKLIPKEVAHFNAVVAPVRRHSITVSPSVSGQPFRSKNDMISYAINVGSGAGWTAVDDEIKAWLEVTDKLVMRKVEIARKTRFDYLLLHATSDNLNDWETKAVCRYLDDAIKTSVDYFPSVILLVWTNPYHYESWLFRKGQPVMADRVSQ